MSIKTTIIFLFFFSINNLFAQENIFINTERKLIDLAENILNGDNDSIKIKSNLLFQAQLLNIIKTKKSYLYNFNDIKHLSILQPKDKKFKLFTWFLPYTNGTYDYFGIIQQCNKRGKKCKIYILQNMASINQKSINQQIDYNDWYGCIYYDIIPIKIKRKKHYTLLGWDGNNNTTTKKIIDVISITKKQSPFFGANIFNNKQKRIILEYSSNYSISLTYDEKLDYIVFDHLEPMDEISINNFDIYVPNLSYDILERTDLGWQLKTNIYLNNQK
tara:strand:- start:386 stop:1207 length:822 start_codon:yes stop_codon:yes gene_type:complete